jgi:hypothetical protein
MESVFWCFFHRLFGYVPLALRSGCQLGSLGMTNCGALADSGGAGMTNCGAQWFRKPTPRINRGANESCEIWDAQWMAGVRINDKYGEI